MELVGDRGNAQVPRNKNEDGCPFRAWSSRKHAGELEYAQCSVFLDGVYTVGVADDENALARDLALHNGPHRVRGSALQGGVRDKSC